MRLLEKHFEIALETPDGITRLRELILKLAMQGLLVQQYSTEEPSTKLIDSIKEERYKLINNKLIKKQSVTKYDTNLEPYKLPNNWTWTYLDNLTYLLVDGSHNPPKNVGSGIPMISGQNVLNNKINLDASRFITEKDLEKEILRNPIKKNDIFLTIVGSIGRSAVVETEINKFGIQRSIAQIRSGLFSYYLCYFLQSPYAMDYLISNAKGTAQLGVYLNKLKVLPVPVPPFEEQKRIVKKIDQLMLLCDKLEAERNRKNKLQLQINSAAINNLIKANDETSFNNAWSFIASQFDTLYTVKQNVTDLKEVVLNLAMRGKLVPQDNQEQSAVELHKEILLEKNNLIKSGSIRKQKELPAVNKDEITYEVPKNWKWVRLNDFGTWKSGSTPNRSNSSFYEGKIPWVKSGEVKQGRIKFTSETITEYALEKCSLHINPVGSVLIAMYGANIGEAGVLEIEAATNQAVCACNTFKGIDNNYLYNLLLSLKNNFISQGAGAAQPNISREKIINTVVPLPPYGEQKRIVRRINQLFELCDKLEKNIEQSSQKQTQILNAVLAQV